MIEHHLAELSVAILREAGVSDAEILSDYTACRPQADRAYELAYHLEHGVLIEAQAVRAEMRRLVSRAA